MIKVTWSIYKRGFHRPYGFLTIEAIIPQKLSDLVLFELQ